MTTGRLRIRRRDHANCERTNSDSSSRARQGWGDTSTGRCSAESWLSSPGAVLFSQGALRRATASDERSCGSTGPRGEGIEYSDGAARGTGDSRASIGPRHRQRLPVRRPERSPALSLHNTAGDRRFGMCRRPTRKTFCRFPGPSSESSEKNGAPRRIVAETVDPASDFPQISEEE